jgi:DNA-binding FadR family transcriptional regulator
MSSTSPARIERQLTLGILNGTYAPGSRLPTVRELAASFGVNQATIQRVVARLETRGLVRARQGSGLAVQDPGESGDMSIVPYWLEANLDDPPRASSILEGFLELRRIVATRLLVRHRARVLEQLGEIAGAAAGATASSADAFRAADLALSRRLLRAMGNPVALALFNTVAKILDEVPIVAAAMYAEPETNLRSWRAVIEALGAGGDDLAERVDAAMADVDRRTVTRFEALLRAREIAS